MRRAEANPLDRELRRALESVALQLKACARCGLCAESCHFYLAEPEPANIPAAKARRLARLRGDALGSGTPAAQALVEAAFDRCTGCGRCALHCPAGVDVATVVRAARALLAAAGRVPQGIARTVENQLQTGNQMAIPREEFVETCAWLADELSQELGSPTALPVDVAGSRVLYLVNPREVKFFPLSLQAAAAIFRAAGESWTMSSRAFDVTNYGFFAGDARAGGELARRTLEQAARLGVSEIVLSECGHGYRSWRWESPGWLGAAHPIALRSSLELFEEYVDQGRIRLDPSRNDQPVTLHDPCNLVRTGGIVEPQRRLLQRAVQTFVEMTPSREQNFCCGGGGGLLAVGEHAARRVASGRIKAEQIRATGARVVACPCHNCADQLLELNKVYKLKVEIRSIAEILFDALA